MDRRLGFAALELWDGKVQSFKGGQDLVKRSKLSIDMYLLQMSDIINVKVEAMTMLCLG